MSASIGQGNPNNFSDLLSRLHNCQKTHNFESLGLGLTNEGKKSAAFYIVFLSKLEDYIRSCKEIDETKIYQCLNSVMLLLPSDNISDTVVTAYKQFSLTIRKMNQNNERGEPKSTFEKQLDVLVKQMSISPKERFENFLSSLAPNTQDEAKAELLQKLLTLLVLEDEYMRKNYTFTQCRLKELAHEHQYLAKEYSDCKQKLMESFEFGFYLQFYECLDPLVHFPCTVKIDQKGLDRERYLYLMQDKVKKLASSPIEILRKLANDAVEAYKYLFTVNHSLEAQIQLMASYYMETFFLLLKSTECPLTHFCSYGQMQVDMNNLDRDTISNLNKSSDLFEKNKRLIEKQKQMQALQRHWMGHRKNQKELFTLALKSLQEIIDRYPRDRLLWQKYKRVPLCDLKEKNIFQLFDVRVFDTELVEDIVFPESELLPPKDEEKPIKIESGAKEDQAQVHKKKSRNRRNLHKSEKVPPKDEILKVPVQAPAVSITKQTTQDPVPKMPGMDFPYSHDRRVLKWIKHPVGAALTGQDFSDYLAFSSDYQHRMHLYHAFPLSVDRFIHLGIRQLWQNPSTGKMDVRYVIPAEFIIKGKTERGLIAYSMNEKGICYHRFFTIKPEKELMQKIVDKSFYESDFPELNAAASQPHEASAQFLSANASETISIDPWLGIVTIEDKAKDLIVRIFPTRQQP